jgi:hypothetical protein
MAGLSGSARHSRHLVYENLHIIVIVVITIWLMTTARPEKLAFVGEGPDEGIPA